MHEHSHCRILYNSKILNATAVFSKKKGLNKSWYIYSMRDKGRFFKSLKLILRIHRHECDL